MSDLERLRTHGQVTRTWVPTVDPSGMIVDEASDLFDRGQLGR